MINWKDRKYINPRKRVFKNMDTNEILNLEIQDDLDNIEEESETPLNAHNLNMAQQDLLDDVSKTYTGTNITGPTVEGYGRIDKLWGHTIEEGSGEKSPTNPYTLRCVGDLIAISNEKMEQGTISSSTGQDSPNDSRVRTKSFIELGAGNYKLSYSGVNDYIILQYTLSGEFVRATNWLSLNVFSLTEKSKLRFVFRKNDTDAITPNDILNLEIIKAIEIISQNGAQQSSNVVVAKPLCCLKDGDNVVAQDWIDYDKGVVHRECGYEIFDGSSDESWVVGGQNRDFYETNLKKVHVGDKTSHSITNILTEKVIANAYQNNSICYSATALGQGTTFRVRPPDDVLNNVTAFKTWLKSNPITVIYKLATPTTEPLDCSNKIVQYADETTVSNRDNAEIEVSLTNNKAISEVNEDIGNVENKIEGAISKVEQTNSELIKLMGNEPLLYKGEVYANVNYNNLEIGYYNVNTFTGVGGSNYPSLNLFGSMIVLKRAQIIITSTYIYYRIKNDATSWSSWKTLGG